MRARNASACVECARLAHKLGKLMEENEWLRMRNAELESAKSNIRGDKDSETLLLNHAPDQLDEPTELEIAICALSDRDQTIARLRQELVGQSQGCASTDECADDGQECSTSHGVRAFGFQSRAFEVADSGYCRARARAPCKIFAPWHALRVTDAHSYRQHNAIFSYEKSSQGKRTYIVATREAFWAFYSAQDAQSRHHYEVIRADRPCRLYFDLEFSRTLNPHANGPRMRRTLVREVCRELGMVFGLSGRVRVRSSIKSQPKPIRQPSVTFSSRKKKIGRWTC